jgi:hypothetical protein
MPAIELPNGDSAILHSRKDITERSVRKVANSYMSLGSTAAKLMSLGFDETKPETWYVWTQLTESEKDGMKDYQSEIIIAMLKSWSRGELPTIDGLLDLPSETYDALSEACAKEYNGVEDFSPDGVADPKAPTEE